MLKIKDNVDLKELEKFGFKRLVYYGYKLAYNCWKWSDGINDIDIYQKTRYIEVDEVECDMGISNDMLEKMFDLVQAGLVEKIEE